MSDPTISEESYVIFSSYGNDSLALIQWAYNQKFNNVVVAYNDTGWASEHWQERVEKAESWVQSLGFTCVRIASEGMENLVRRKKAWPRGGGGKYQFCTANLKQLPALEWLHTFDPGGDSICLVGIRREESPNRAQFPEWTEESPSHGGRALWAPLVRFTARDRDFLLGQTPFLPLNHRSKECYPCVNAKQSELAALPLITIDRIARLEKEMGVNSKGNKRVMFSPKRYGGSTGIQEVVDYVQRKQSKQLNFQSCDSGWCDP